MLKKALIMIILSVIIFPGSALSGRRENDRDKCIALEALARSQCKDTMDYSYVGKREGNIYIFNTFYGSRYRDFFCKVDKDSIIILSRKKTFRRDIEYRIDADGCAVIDYQSGSCPKRGVVRCCIPKSAEDKKNDKEAEFWDRPVPELLKEDQLKAIQDLKNRTAKASESKQEKQSAE